MLVTDKNHTRLTQQPFEFADGGQLVVVSSPVCNPCRRLFDWMKTEPELMKVMSEKGAWITNVASKLYWQQLIDANKTNGSFRMHYTWKKSEWPEIDSWATPSFYFYRDGQLVSRFAGWPNQGNEAALRKGLKQVGLL